MAEPQSVDDLFPAQSVDELFPAQVERDRYRRQTLGTSPIQDLVFGDTRVNPVARVLDAFGQGAKQTWGATDATRLSKEAEDHLKVNKLFDSWNEGQNGLIKAANEALFRPAAVQAVKEMHDAEALYRGVGAVFHGIQGAVSQTGEELSGTALDKGMQALGAGSTIQLGHDVAGAVEALQTGLRQPTGIPHAPPHPALVEARNLQAEIAHARALGVIGEGEAGYMGTKEPGVAPPISTPYEAPEAAETPVAKPGEVPAGLPETAPEARPVATPEMRAAIEGDVTQKLVAAGRPAEEAAASAQLIASHYEARAERFGGALGTAEELYKAEGADIRAGRGTAPTRSEPIRPDSAGGAEAPREMAQGLDLGKELNQAAYHGSPYDFEAFDTGKIGTGEGAQAYGHGLYFAENEVVAREYQKGVIDKEWFDKTNARLSQIAREMEPEKVPGSYDKFKTQKGRDLKAEYDQLLQERADKKGTLYRVNIKPEPHEFLQWEKPLNKQTPEIQAKLKQVLGDSWDERKYADASTAIRNGMIAFHDETVSKKLAEVGIPGIRYLDERSRGPVPASMQHSLRAQGLTDIPRTHNYVVFDPKHIEITDKNGKPVSRKEFELDQIKRGKINFREGDVKPIITLLKDANASTFIHETGHQWLEELVRDANHEKAPALLRDDAEAVRSWLGVHSLEDIKTSHHEKFARGFERYMMEGKAPNQALANVFAKFKNWLTQIYQTVTRLKSPINDEVRGVFDRLLTMHPGEVKIEPEGPPKTFADVHEADAISTAPENARPVAQTIQAERDMLANQHVPEEHDARLEGIASGVSRREAGGPQPLRDGNAPGPDIAEAGNNPASGAVGAGGSNASAEGARPSVGGGKTEPPTGSQARFEGTGSALVDKAGNIRLDTLSTGEDINKAIRDAAEQNNDFIDARRGVITDGQVLELADALGMDESKLNARKLGQAFNAEEVMAARKLLIQSATGVRDAMVKAAEGAEADVLTYAEAKARHQMIQEQVAGLTAEAGRALRAFRKLEGQQEAGAIGAFLKDATGKTLFQLQREAQLGLQLETPAQVSKFVNDSSKPTWKDMVIEAWITALLSGPKTHVANVMGNTISGLWRPVETLGAAAVGKVLGSADRVRLGEAKAELFGMVQGAREGVVAAYKAFKTEEPQLTSTLQTEKNYPKALPTFDIGGYQIGGKQARIPLRLLGAEDEFFKSVAFRGDINRQAYAIASKENLPAEQMNARVAELSMNPTEAMINHAKDIADYQTFQTPLGKFGKALQSAANSHMAVKFILPFVRTPLNLLKYAGERTPLGIFYSEVRDNLAGKNGNVARDTQISRIALGTMIGVATYELASQGLITGGGPADKNKKAVMQANGWQDYSVRIGDIYYRYNRLDPFSVILGVVADAYEIYHASGSDHPDKEKIPSMVFAAVTQNILNRASLQGASDLIQALTDHERYGRNYIKKMAGTIVPAISSQTAQALDPVVREARTALDGIKARIPGLSQTLLPKRDVWGEPITREGGLGPDIASPIIEARMKNDPVNKALLDAGHFPGHLGRKIRGVELTDEQYDDYSRIAGRMAKTRLNSMINVISNQNIPAASRAEVIKTAVESSREAARSLIIMQSVHTPNDIMKKAREAKTLGLH